MNRIIAFICLLFSYAFIYAYDIELDGIYYNLNNTAKTAEVTNRIDRYGMVTSEYSGSITIPSSITYEGIQYTVNRIGEMAFIYCPVTEIGIPESILSIGGGAFILTGLTHIDIPETVQKIEGGAFSNCEYLSEVKLPNNLLEISECLFGGCHSLQSISIPETVTRIGLYAFNNCGLTSIIIPESVTELGEEAFADCNNLESVSLSNSIERIEQKTFQNCRNINCLNIPNNAVYIGKWAFQNCEKLSSIIFPNKMERIDFAAFVGCPEITEVTFGTKMAYIGEYIFYDSNKIEKIYSHSNTPPSIMSYESFSNYKSKLYVPAQSIDDYKSSSWCRFDKIFAIAEDLVISNTSLELEVGFDFMLTAIELPEADTDQLLYWTSSDPSIASVDSNGLVTAVSKGEATITVNSLDGSGLKAYCKVFVNDPIVLATSIQLSENQLIMEIGEVITLSATILPSDATDRNVNWVSSNESVITVQNGCITAINAGSAAVIASTNDGTNLMAFCNVTVNDPPVFATTIKLDKNEITIRRKDSEVLSATIYPYNTTNKAVLWESDDPSIVTVLDGQIFAQKAGNTKVRVSTCDGTNLMDSCLVSVNPILVEEIELNYQSYTLDFGDAVQLQATIIPEDADNSQVIWSSSNESIIRVNNQGFVWYVSAGSAVIYARSSDGSDVEATCEFSVVNGLEEILQDTNQCLYTIDGRHITSTHKGIYIVKKSDGTVSKILK